MKKFQVAIVGINSLFGGTSALLLKQSPFVKCLKLYDSRNIEAAQDISMINTQCHVKMYRGEDQLENAFQEADIIVISDEAQEMLDMDSHLMRVSSKFGNYAKAIARSSPDAIVVIASMPVNCLLPMMSQLLAKNGCYNHNKVLGTTTVDTVRASALLASRLRLDPREVVLPVIGGSSENTRVPVFSQARPFFSIKPEVKSSLITEIRRGDSMVLANKGSPEVLNRAHSTVRFLNSIMSGLNGQSNVTDITLCRTDMVPGVEYFSLPVMLGKDGIAKRFGVPKTTSAEDEMIEEAIKQVKKDSDRAAFVVRRALELPDNKFSTASDRASTQKEMFDLYVKSLPEPENNQRSTVSKNESKSTYSFRTLINAEPTMIVDPFDIPENKSFQKMVKNKLKTLASEESLLKSTGFYESPMQRPISILEPMDCPSAPMEASNDSNLDDIYEEAGKTVLHEKHLKEGSQNENGSSGNKLKEHYIVSTANVNQKKHVDPIAKFKEQILKSMNSNGQEIEGEDVYFDSKTAQPDENIFEEIPQNFEKAYAKENLRSSKKSRKTKHREQKEFTSSAGELNKDVRNNRKQVSQFNADTGTRWSDVYEPKENRDNQFTEEGLEEDVDRLFCSTGKPKHGDFDSMMATHDSNTSFVQGVYFPTKTFYPESTSSHRRSNNFRESAVKSRGRKNARGHIVPFKSPFKANDTTLYDVDDANRYLNGSMVFNKVRKPPPKSKPIRSAKQRAARKEINKNHDNDLEEKETKNEELIHVVCPNCQNKLTCLQSENSKLRRNNNTEPVYSFAAAANLQPEEPRKNSKEQETAKEIQQTVKEEYQNLKASKPMTANDDSRIPASLHRIPEPKCSPFEPLQEQRLKRLKEKINQKLIPLLNNDRQTASTEFQQMTSTNKRSLAQTKPVEKTEERFMGTPLVLVDESKKTEGNKPSKSETQTASGAKWQGVPFVLKRDQEDTQKTNEENQKLQTSAKPLTKETRLKERHLFKGPIKVEPKIEEKVIQKKEVAKIIKNKLQLLSSKGNLKVSKIPDARAPDDNNTNSFNTMSKGLRKTLSKRLGAFDLGLDDVRKYMHAKTIETTEIKIKPRSDASDSKQDNMIKKLAQKLPHQERKFAVAIAVENPNASVQVDSLKKTAIDTEVKVATEEAIKASATSQAKSDSTDGDNKQNDVPMAEKTDKVTVEIKQKPAQETQITAEAEAEEAHTKAGAVTKAVAAPKAGAATKAVAAPKSGDAPLAQLKNVATQDKNKIVERIPQESQKELLETILKESIQKSLPKKNKLHLLTINRGTKQPEKEARNDTCKDQGAGLTSKKSTHSATLKTRFSKDDYDTKSAAVKIAQRFDTKKPDKPKVKSSAPEKATNILEGLNFPPKKVPKAKAHPKSLLKELSSTLDHQESEAAKIQEQTLKALKFKRRPVVPLSNVHLGKHFDPEMSHKFSRLFQTGTEYVREEDQIAKLASEVIKKRKLNPPSTIAQKVAEKQLKTGQKRTMNKIISKKTPKCSRYLDNLPREKRIQKKPSSISTKLVSMPHIRHQPEHFELLLGPIEVRPGLARFNFGKMAIGSCFSPDNCLESTLFNEYTRTNLLPSLKEMRETIILEDKTEQKSE